MPEKDSEIKISDRRRFTAEGELRPDAEEKAEQEAQPAAPPEAAVPSGAAAGPAEPGSPSTSPPAPASPPPPPVSEAERQAGREAFSSARTKLDEQMRSAFGPRYQPEKMEANFETFVASLYMSAMLQLGLMHEEGEQPQVDLVGARHTIDTIAMLEEKTRGNLTEAENALFDDVLFRLRMAFVEVTNVLTRGPEPEARK